MQTPESDKTVAGDDRQLPEHPKSPDDQHPPLSISPDSTSSSSTREVEQLPTTLPISHSQGAPIPTFSSSQDDSLPIAHIPKKVPKWWQYRQMMREYIAEFAGVMILIIFGDGVVCQRVLSLDSRISSFPYGEYLSNSFGWASGVAVGVWISTGISGGHINPAVTIAMATFRGFPWKKVPGYICAQMLGGMVGAGIVYANYIHAIDIVEGGRHVRTLKTAGLFSTYALDYMTNVSCFFIELTASAILIIGVLTVTDRGNAGPSKSQLPIALWILLVGIGASLGMETGYAINPARDLGPRLLTSMVGYGSQVYTFRNHYWLWCAVLGPIIGCLVGAFLYDFLLYDGPGGRFRPKIEPGVLKSSQLG
ncbi:Aquaporine-6 [Stygiomarasmius scandens]|uniref:Aquaporine-6 n=1 Tax=Marasmiellus scandens TaxID=2682957 RepID=A0ABR1J9J2_9AGAR